MLQENHFNSNRFKSSNKIDLTNRIKERKSLGFGTDEFNFLGALKSINVKSLKFTNFFKGRKDVMFRYARAEYKRLTYGRVNLDDEYEMKIVNVDKLYNEFKIKSLYENTHNIRLRKLPIMYKLKSLQNPNFQLYVIGENRIFKVCFIDIYHLAIPTRKEDIDEKYNSNKNNDYCLSNFEDKINENKEIVSNR